MMYNCNWPPTSHMGHVMWGKCLCYEIDHHAKFIELTGKRGQCTFYGVIEM